jgi:acetoin utilization protein AcuB
MGGALLVRKEMAKKLVTISPGTGILKAMELMRKASIRHLPVLEGSEFLGLVTEGVLRQAMLLSMVDKVTIEDVMIKSPVTVSPDAGIEEAARLIFTHKIGGLPVIQGKELVGMITTVDILRAFLGMMGILKSSSRIDLRLGKNPEGFEEVSKVCRDCGSEIISVGMSNHKDRRRRVYHFRLSRNNVAPIVATLKERGYKVLGVRQ